MAFATLHLSTYSLKIFFTLGILCNTSYVTPSLSPYLSGVISLFFAAEILLATTFVVYNFSSNSICLTILLIKLLESVVSYTVKSRVKPIYSCSSLKIRENCEWKVPIATYLAKVGSTISVIRDFISRAALFVKVRTRIEFGA